MSQYPNPTKQRILSPNSPPDQKFSQDPQYPFRSSKDQDSYKNKYTYISSKDDPFLKNPQENTKKTPTYALNSDLDSLKYRIYPEETTSPEEDAPYLKNSYESDPMNYPYQSKNEDLETVPERSIESEMTYKTSMLELPTNKNSFKADDDFFPNSTRKSEQKLSTFDSMRDKKAFEGLNTSRGPLYHEADKIKVIENLKQENLNKISSEELQGKFNAMILEYEGLKSENLYLRNEKMKLLEDFSMKLGFFQSENEKLKVNASQLDEELFYRKQEIKRTLEEIRGIKLEKEKYMKNFQGLQAEMEEVDRMNQILLRKNKEMENEFHLHMEESNLLQEKKLEEKLNEIVNEKQYKFHTKERKFKENSERLRNEMESLKMQNEDLAQKIKAKDYEIDLLSNRKPEKSSHKINYSLASPLNMKKMLDELLVELDIKANSLEELHAEIAEFKNYYKQVRKFADLVLDMTINCHPHNYFPSNKPTLKQTWKWLKSVLEKYMILKKSTLRNEGGIKVAMAAEENNELITILMENLKVSKKTEILTKFYECLNENNLFNRLLPKIKRTLKVDKKISLKDLERKLDEIC